MMSTLVELSVVRGDVSEVASDLLLLKYAQRFYGADESVIARLSKLGVANERDVDLAEGEMFTVETKDALSSARVVFLGTQALSCFRYKEMRGFARQSIEIIDREGWPVRTLTATVHGAGYGLDVEESLHAMSFGFQQAIASGLAPSLERIVFVERNARRYDLLKNALSEMPHLARPASTAGSVSDNRDNPASARADRSDNPPATTVPDVLEPVKKKLVFVAMPFAQEFDDVYQFGIYGTVRRCGFVCERVDESFYAGNMVDRIMDGIRRAEFVIADLTAERPNVYLEVGYAWGLNRPVILTAREGERLHFDLSHHKCIFYPTIGKLAEQLEHTIRELCGVERTSSREEFRMGDRFGH
ncbi:MAG: hypothetical protein ABI619_00780 [Betaproteobacteria bacterium]